MPLWCGYVRAHQLNITWQLGDKNIGMKNWDQLICYSISLICVDKLKYKVVFNAEVWYVI